MPTSSPSLRLFFLASTLLSAAACGSSAGSGPPPVDAGGGTDAVDEAAVDAGAHDAAPDAPAFPTAMHPDLPQIPDLGGHKIAHPELVVITFADDPNRATLESFTRWMVGSSWLHDAGAEYGLGNGTVLRMVERSEPAPSAVTDTQAQDLIAQGIMNGTLPRGSDGTLQNVIYALFYPSHTTITVPATSMTPAETSCMEFGGYHDEGQAGSDAFTYMVVPNCSHFDPGLSPLETEELSASHELFEASTDPLPQSDPGWTLPDTSFSPWLAIGGEIGDLCALPYEPYRSSGYVVTRVWSNAAAMAGNQDPCVPAPASPPYFTVSVDPDRIESVAAGASRTYALTAWSTGPVAPFYLATEPSGTFTPTTSFDRTTVNNGDTATLTVGVPAGTPSGAYALIYLYAAHSMTDYHVWPVVVAVP